MRKIKIPAISVSVIILVTLSVFMFTSRCSFAESERPKEGSVKFGAAEKPVIKTNAQFNSFKNVFADIAEKVLPSVVSITSTQIDTVVYRNPYDQFFSSPFDQFFGFPQQRRNPKQQQQEPHKEERRKSGTGSGVIVSKDGYILTNHHVVADADEITIRMDDDREYEAEVVGVDSLSDVAVIKIKEDVKDLPAAYIGNSDNLRPGDWVLAAGNPFNLSSTVTTGIVSALGRNTGSMTTYQNYIQTDAAINPGNSGGALVNIEGELIGINTMIYTRSGGYMGIGFAIPINMAKRIMEQLIYKGKVTRGWLGVQIGDIDKNMMEALGLENKDGVLISDVFEGEPADKAGIQAGDVILSINGIETKDANELKNSVAAIDPGKKVPVIILRDGKKKTLHVKLSDRDKRDSNPESKDKETEESDNEIDLTKRLGFQAQDLTDDIKDQLNLRSSDVGAVVTTVDKSSMAARKGIQKYDIIRKIKVSNRGFIKITNAESLKNAIRGIGKGSPVLMHVQRGKQMFFVAIKTR